MRHLLSILAALCLLSAPACAQTLKSLMFNSTNGQVVANTGTNVLMFTNTVNFGSDFAVASPAGEFQWNGVTFFEPETKVWSSAFSFDNTTNAANTRANLGFSTNLNTLWTATNAATARTNLSLGAAWLTNTNVGTFRSDIGLPLAALTNTSNVTMIRALAGSTNTNHPFSGNVSVVGTNNTNTLVFSNGILVEVQ